jgi:hypothetical protein
MFQNFKNEEPLYIILCITGNLIEYVGFSLSYAWCLGSVMYFNQVGLCLLFWKTGRELSTQFPSTVDRIATWNDVYTNISYLKC